MAPRALRALAAATAAAVLLLVGALVAPPAAVAARAIALPPVHGRFDYQIGGAYPPAPSVRIVDRDRTDRPAAGRYGICYVNGFQTQQTEAAFWTKRHPGLLLHDREGG